jgi:hypothetical protein
VKKNFITTFLILFFLFTTNLKSDDQIDKLKILLEKGLITESEFKKAVELTGSRVSKIDIRKISGKSGREKFEKYEFYIDNYRVHTLGPGTVRIDNILTGETDVTLTENFISKITKDGKKNFKFEFNEEELKSNLLYKGQVLINWTARYVRRYQATFHQMQVLGYQPFHYFIMLPGKNPIALNFNLFNKKIDKAVAKVKQELSIKYNLSISDIDKIMEKKENVVSKEQEKIIKELTEKYAGKEITDAIRQEIEKTIGEEMANAFISEIEQYTGQAIDKAVEQELASAINEAISYAVQQGVSEATAAAAIEAMIIVYALGGTDEDAMEACRSIAGDAC